MDREFEKRIQEATGEKTIVFSLANNTSFINRTDELYVNYKAESGNIIEYKLKAITDLFDGNEEFISADGDWLDKYLPLLNAIEAAIGNIYKNNIDLKDKNVLFAIERLIKKPDIYLQDDLIIQIQNSIRLILSTAAYSKNELIGCLQKIKRSVKRHHTIDGSRGYLDFIKDRI